MFDISMLSCGLGLSIIIPNRNASNLLPLCVAFLESRSGPFELIIVDNGSDDPAVWAIYSDLERRFEAQIIKFDQSFNYSRMINIGVAAAKHPVVLLLNNDVVIPEPALLDEAFTYAVRPDVGVVGSILSYPDGRVQHAGMLLRMSREGSCEVDHVLRFAAGEEGEYPGALTRPNEWQAVTGAFQMMRRKVFQKAGGYDEVNLPVEHNDVDFCLRVRALGLRVVCLPLKGITHDESHTRSKMEREKARKLRCEARSIMRVRWADAFLHDPFCNAYAGSKYRTGLDRPPKPRKRMIERLRRVWGRVARGLVLPPETATRAQDLREAWARAGLPLRLQPGVSIVGRINSAGEVGEVARFLGQACNSANIPLGYVQWPSGRQRDTGNAVITCEAYPHRLVSLLVAEIGELAEGLMGLGEGRIRIAMPLVRDVTAVHSAADTLDEFEEIWAISGPVAAALAVVTNTPVRLMSLQRVTQAKPPVISDMAAISDMGNRIAVALVELGL